ncbi:MAG: sn-glycerol-3-phosphate ABC transporter ATP-binding protein UgpC [Alphaproteobacteria bacterium]|nr:sn-glycerol-3-phosphate ABC transporter ATP-binding protein UgpC [Alphaproteobacteria bacterium]
MNLSNVCKNFGNIKILENISLHINSGEFIVFLGPSGCGKSTLLRMIAGLEDIDEGQIHIGDRRVDQLAPNKRGIAMVFQNYALYPHMTVRQNMSFGLTNIGTDKKEIIRRVDEAASTLEITQLLDRRPAELSGGQRQRVAIGRAIVREPIAFLLDEPLSNLDAALRGRTRIELAQLHQRIKATMVYVTHDQTEAMTLANRIVIMNNRKIEQVGTPMEIYSKPVSRFVAGFIGSPAMNFMPITQFTNKDGKANISIGTTNINTDINVTDLTTDHSLTFGVRPDALSVAENGKGQLSGTVEIVERLGDRTLLHVRLSDNTIIVAEDIGKSRLEPNSAVSLNINLSETHIFDKQGKAYHVS